VPASVSVTVAVHVVLPGTIAGDGEQATAVVVARTVPVSPVEPLLVASVALPAKAAVIVWAPVALGV
jgi:hypothetical protein